jgi:hypothetical protein
MPPEQPQESRRAHILLGIACASALVWLVHSFAVRNLILAIEQTAHKLAR